MDPRTGLYDIYGLWHVPFWQTTWFFWACICFFAVVMVVVGALIWWRIRSKKISISYWDQALLEISQLLRTPVLDAEQSYYIYTQLIGILKHYLSTRYTCNAQAMTDDELLIFLSASDCPVPVVQVIERLLKESLTIRFAGHRAHQHIVEEAVGSAVIVVKQTIPAEQKSA